MGSTRDTKYVKFLLSIVSTICKLFHCGSLIEEVKFDGTSGESQGLSQQSMLTISENVHLEE